MSKGSRARKFTIGPNPTRVSRVQAIRRSSAASPIDDSVPRRQRTRGAAKTAAIQEHC